MAFNQPSSVPVERHVIGARDSIPVALADQQQRLGKRRDLAGVIGMIVAKYQYSSCEQLAVHRQTWTTKEQDVEGQIGTN